MTQNLLTLQQNFINHLLDEKNKNILPLLNCKKMEAISRLEIYRNNVFGAIESLMSSIYPTIKNILGEEKFFVLVRKYYKKFPSKSGNLNDYGDKFGLFLKKEFEMNPKFNFLYDLAKLEYIYHQAYFISSNNKKFDLEKFKKITPKKLNNIKFTLSNSYILFNSTFPIYSIFKQQKIIKSNNKESVLIAWSGVNAEIINLSKDDLVFLKNVKKQKNLYEIYNKLSNPDQISEILDKFISNNILTEFLI